MYDNLVVTKRTRHTKTVKNLSYLLAHRHEVKSFDILDPRYSLYFYWNGEKRQSVTISAEYKGLDGAIMIADLGDKLFICRWADTGNLLRWIHRPSFRGLPVTWFGWSLTIGDNYRETIGADTRHT